MAASGDRNLDWFFAEPEAAAFAVDLFNGYESLRKINVVVVPAP